MTKITGTPTAFYKMLEEDNVHKKLGVSKQQVWNWRHKHFIPSLNKMEEMLIKSGATVLKEKVWRLKS